MCSTRLAISNAAAILSMVELEPVAAEAVASNGNGNGGGEGHAVNVFADMMGDDAARLRDLIENHRRYTNSARAQQILANWE